jgi:RNA polymerase sigma-B factor
MLQRRAQAGDGHARERLIEKHLALAAHLARSYARGTEPLEDLVQVARLGLVKAAERWDPDLGTFGTYAAPTIAGELRRYFRDSTWLVRPPRALQEASLRVAKVRAALAQELGHEPTVDDIAGRLGLPREVVVEATDAARAQRPVSLDRPLHTDRSGALTHREALVDRRDDLTRCEDDVAFSQMSATLPAREREVVRLRFELDLLQREIAARVGCSQMHVSRILSEALTRLRGLAEGAPATE